ncbi:MAG: hypothetical protein HOW97_25480 [Catenulispora sp.]|nr:hypothetical protein [Catenulispora sp.]
MKPTTRDPAHPLRDDRGSISIFVAICLLALMGFVALVFDGVGKLNAEGRYNDIASEAARAGAQGIDPTLAIPGTTVQADSGRATRLAHDYLAQYGLDGTVTVTPDGKEIEVRITGTYHPLFADALGKLDLSITGYGHADLVYRVD